jgi:hypothetical protein
MIDLHSVLPRRPLDHQRVDRFRSRRLSPSRLLRLRRGRRLHGQHGQKQKRAQGLHHRRQFLNNGKSGHAQRRAGTNVGCPPDKSTHAWSA